MPSAGPQRRFFALIVWRHATHGARTLGARRAAASMCGNDNNECGGGQYCRAAWGGRQSRQCFYAAGSCQLMHRAGLPAAPAEGAAHDAARARADVSAGGS